MEAKADWTWDTFPHYRLSREVVNGFLLEIFGSFDFKIQVNIFRCLQSLI